MAAPKRYFVTIVLVCMSQLGFAQFAGGDGTAANPFLVATPDHLNNVRNHLNTTTLVHFRQTANIDLSSFANWVPIGGGGTTDIFNGVYDGAGHTISNLTINRPTTDDVGLFGRIGPNDAQKLSATQIRNLGLRNVSISGRASVGALAGRVIGNEVTVIQNCYVVGGAVTGDSHTGGLVGSNNSYVTYAPFDGRRPIIRQSYSSVNVVFSGSGTSNERFGGLVGCNRKGIIDNSYSFSSVTVLPTGTASKVGGLAGTNDALGIIRQSYSAGAVTVNGNVSLAGGLLGTQGTSGYPGSVTDSYWDTQTSGMTSSAAGFGRTTAQMKTQTNYVNWDFINIWNIVNGDSYPFLRGMDLLSGFDVVLAVPGIKTAGQSFDLSVTNAINANGIQLDGPFRVIVTTNIEAEKGVPNGEILNTIFTFTGGTATVTGLICTVATTHTLTVNIESIPSAETLPVQVGPAAASLLVIQQQPQDLYSGNFDNQPVNLGNIVVVSTDQFFNNSAVGLQPGQMVTASIENDGSAAGNAILGGTLQVPVYTCTATFNNLTIDREGTGYTLRFASTGPVNLGWVVSEPFNVQNITDLSGFDVTAVTPQHQHVMFPVNITNARISTGELISGGRNVQITSSVEGLLFNQSINFSNGSATINLSLETIGLHTLTIIVQGVTVSETLDITVEADQSGFTLDPVPSPQLAMVPFDLTIRGARGMNGAFITSARVIVESNISGEGVVFDQVVNNFNATGDAVIPLTLSVATSPGSHILTVTIETITLSQSVSVVVEPNPSGFTLTGPLTDVDAGDPFDLSVSDAFNIYGPLNGSFNVQVTSNLAGVVFDQGVNFVAGIAVFPVTLNQASLHTLTVAITTIVPVNTINVNVIPNLASALQIVSQDLGRTGTSAGTPVIIGTVTLRSVDKVGNPSVRGLSGTQNVVASLQVDGSSLGNATLGGTLTRNILPTGTVTFDDLTLNRNGTGFVVRFTSASPVNLGFVDTNPFNMSGVEDQRSFKVAHPGPQVIGVNFTVTIYNATYPDGTHRNGSYPVMISSPIPIPPFSNLLYWANASFSNGQAVITTTSPYTVVSNRDTWFIIEDHVGSQKIITVQVVSTDGSGFAITDPGPQNAGVSFNLGITNARDKAGNLLNGRNHMVTVTSSNTAEGVGGQLFRDSLLFTAGGVTIPNLVLTQIGTQNITVAIDWITNPQTIIGLQVNPGPAVAFQITIQPAGGTGNFDNVPVHIGNVELQFTDQFGNPTNFGLTGTLTVSTQIETGPVGAVLGGTITRDIVNGRVLFDNLTLNRNGTYTLRFTYNGTLPVFQPLISGAFVMSNIENLSGFDVTHPGRQYQNLPFNLSINNARDNTGALLTGNINVTVSTDQPEGIVFNNPVTFTNGAALVNITLNTLAFHDLTVSVAGVLNNVIVQDVEVVPDLSGFSLALNPPGGPFYQLHPFDLIISNATNRDGIAVNGPFNVTVASSIDGTVFSGTISFAAGSAMQSITLISTGTHQLTVTIAGITHPQNIEVANVLSNQSGFDLALEIPGDKTAGVGFNLSITNARDLNGILLQGDQHRIIVTSDLSGVVYDQNVNMFTDGNAMVAVNLTLAGIHTLTVSVAGITGTRDVLVTVLAAEASQLMITTQPTGGSGNQDNQPVFIGNVIVGTFDAFGNPSVSGLGGTQTVTAAIAHDPSLGAILGGTLTRDISTGTATFDNLTLNREGTGFTLSIAYDGTPALSTVFTIPFNISNLYITYTISLDVGVVLNFGEATVGYAPLTPHTVTITRTGTGDITNLAAALSGPHSGDFTLNTSLLPGAVLTAGNPSVTFTAVPNHNLSPGVYSATVTVTADNGVNQTFEVLFTVLHSYTISLSSANLIAGVVDFGTGTEGFYVVTPEVVTITRTGTGVITNLLVSLTGPAAASFAVTQPVLTTLDATNNFTTFTVEPIAGLLSGSYQATVTVTADNGVSQSFNVLFNVIEQFAISLAPVGDIDFGIHPLGYSPLDSVTITVTNVGSAGLTQLSASLSGGAATNFNITQPTPTNLPTTGSTATFTIVPRHGLPVGTYTETVSVTAAELAVPASFNVTFIVGQVYSWVGHTSDWNTPLNWAPPAVPTGSVFIILPGNPAGGIHPVISAQNATIYNMTVENGAILTINPARRLTVQGQGLLTIRNNAKINAPGNIRILTGGRMVMNPGARATVTGTIENQTGPDGLVLESSSAALTASLIFNSPGVQATVQRWMTGRIFTVISPPVIGDRIEDFLARNPVSRRTTQPLVHAMQIYNEVGGWSPLFPVGTTGELLHGRAYSVRIGPLPGAVVSFRGVLHSSGLTVPVTRQLFGWNGLGNPYTSSIGITQASVNGFLNDNLSQLDPEFAGIWIWDQSISGYRIINNMPQGGFVQDHLAVGQGFIIKARQGGGNVAFNANIRHHQQPQFFKRAPALWHNIQLAARIRVTDTTFRFVSTFIGFNSAMTRGLDVSYDGGMFEPDPNLMIFTRMVDGSRDLNLAVQALPDDFQNMIIPVGFGYPRGGEVLFTAQSLNVPYYVDVMLEDRLTGTFTNLATADYLFNLPAGSQPVGRFFIHLMERIVNYPVNFSVEGLIGGTITAMVGQNNITSGSEVQRSSRIEFSAISNPGFRLKGWNVNGLPVEPLWGDQFVVESLESALDVKALFEEITVDVEGNDLHGFRIFAYDKRIFIYGPLKDNMRVMLYDINGRRLITRRLRETPAYSFAVNDLVSGVYILRLTGGQKPLSTKLLID